MSKIPYPTPEEKRRAIQTIIDDVYGPEEMWYHMWNRYVKQIGWHEWLTFPLFYSCSVVLLFVWSLQLGKSEHPHDVIIWLTLILPIVLGSVMTWSVLYRKWMGIWELEMTLRWNVYQLLSIRLLYIVTLSVVLLPVALWLVFGSGNAPLFWRTLLFAGFSLIWFGYCWAKGLFQMRRKFTLLFIWVKWALVSLIQMGIVTFVPFSFGMVIFSSVVIVVLACSFYYTLYQLYQQVERGKLYAYD